MNNITLTSNYYYSSSDSAWIDHLKDHIDYNLSFPYSELILPTTWWWFGTPASFMVTAMYGEEYNNGSWMDSYHDTFYYTALNIIGIPENKSSKVRIYPNLPATNKDSWELHDLSIEFELSDVAGRLVMKLILIIAALLM